MDDRLVLMDYEPVPAEEKDFCQSLQLAIDDGKFDILIPEFLKDDEDKGKPQVFRTYQDKYRVGKYAGILYYKGRTVVIHSRFDGKDDQNHFLNYALAAAGRLPMKVLRTAEETACQGSFDLILAQLFLTQLRDAHSVGVYREYRTFQHNDSSPRGYLDIARHIRLNPLPNGKIACSTREYTPNNPINHLILAAWGCLCARPGTGAFARQLLQADPSLKRPLDELNWSLGTPDISRPALNRTAQKTLRPIVHPLHQRYETVRRTALLILKEAGLDLFRAESLQVGGLLIPMDKTWELMLEHAVLSKVGDVSTQKEIPVLLQEKRHGMRVFKPDFLFGCRQEKQRTMADIVLDAKYRRAWENACLSESGGWSSGVRDDVFQVLSYMYVTAARAGGVLCPLPESRGGIRRSHTYQICQGMDDRFQLIPLMIPDETGLSYTAFCHRLDACCEACAQKVRDMLADVRAV